MNDITKVKTIYVVGINDADYIISPTINGKQVMCPFYRKWHNMLKRCYSVNYQVKQPSYVGCTVSKEWLTFSNFKAWMEKQDWQGKQLDKDLLIQGNKIYSPEACLFVTKYINGLLTNCKSARGKLPQGVCWDKQAKKYTVKCNVNGKPKYLGLFDTPKAASEAYKTFKYNLISEVAQLQVEPLRSALLNYKILGE
jgi:hypothetical protein